MFLTVTYGYYMSLRNSMHNLTYFYIKSLRMTHTNSSMRYKKRYNYRVVVSAYFVKVLHETVRRLAKIAPIKYSRDGSRIIIYAVTRNDAEMLAKLASQYFCIVLTYKHLIPHNFCNISIVIEENK
jgi:hypothetical protein